MKNKSRQKIKMRKKIKKTKSTFCRLDIKREINSTIRIKLMEAECYSRSIEQWYEQTVNLDRHQKEYEGRREVERKKRDRAFGPKDENTGEV